MLYARQKLLLALIEAFGGQLSNINLQKYLFLFTQKCQADKSYEFVPYRYGCFSFQSYADRRKMVEFGLLQDKDSWQLEDRSGTRFQTTLGEGLQKKLKLFATKYRDLTGNDLVREVYRDYPYFATRSEIASDLMSDDELAAIEAAKPKTDDFSFFTIGYEGQSFENYLNRLIQNDVRLLCDVRKNPLSRKYGFSKKTLSETLAKLGIQYAHLPNLGIVSDKRRELKSQQDYERLFDEYEATTLKENNASIDELVSLFKANRRIAITCFEAEHCMCHRSRVATALSARPDWETEIVHI